MSDEIPEVLHPVRGTSLTPLERQLWRFRMVAVEVQSMLRGYYSVDDVARVIPDELMFSLTNHALILVSKFLEVWDDFGSLATAEPRVVPARQAVDPFVSRLLVWKGLETFRNTVLAHPYETKDGKLVGPWYLLHSRRAPTYHAEAILLLHLVNLTVAAILSVFYQEYRALGPALRATYPSPDAGPGISRGDQIQPAHRALTAEVDKRLKALGVPASNPVFGEFTEATNPKK